MKALERFRRLRAAKASLYEFASFRSLEGAQFQPLVEMKLRNTHESSSKFPLFAIHEPVKVVASLLGLLQTRNSSLRAMGSIFNNVVLRRLMM